MDIDLQRKRLLYRANYRGFREADLLIGGFAKAHVRDMSEEELTEFESLLKYPDRELYAWATGTAEPPANVPTTVLERLRRFDLRNP
ncbi:MAG: succinate dehydrogenase assembly factor 2 [Pseudomonadota bacterium]